MRARLLVILSLLCLAACGGGGGGGYSGSSGGGTFSSSSSSSASSSSSSSSSSSGANSVTISVDAGPAGASGNVNIPYVTVTVCAPGTLICQTIDHIIVDTGSTGLRLEREALNANLIAALPKEDAGGGASLAECYQYVDGYVWGTVRRADFAIGGENVSNMPVHVIGDSDADAVPSDCSSGGGKNHDTIAGFGANGIIGIDTSPVDCGAYCVTHSDGGFYYQCASATCAPTLASLSQQVVNPVAAMDTDNNGTVMVLPAVASPGADTVQGTLYFGIGTRANNALGTHRVHTTSSSSLLTVTYKGQALTKSFIDSGTNFYGFQDSAIAQCTGDLKGFYCPTSSLSLSATVSGLNGTATDIVFPVDNTKDIASTTYNVLPGLAGDPTAFDSLTPVSNSFDLGLPFFFGRSVYTAISGRNAGGVTGPYVAF